jgi:transposase
MKQLSDFELGRICALKEEGHSLRYIAEKLGRTHSTIMNVLFRLRTRGDVNRKSGSGRPRVLNSNQKAVLSSILKKEPKLSVPKMNIRLQNRSGVSVSDETLQRELKRQGVFAYSPIKRPLLLNRHKISRFDICSKWSYESKSFWDDVIFSDECKFNLENSDGIQNVWRKPGRRLQERYVTTTVKHGGGSVIAWGGVYPPKD